MKKIIVLMILIMITITLDGCGRTTTQIELGTYLTSDKDSSSSFMPHLVLLENNQFELYPTFDSCVKGDYEVEENHLILETNDGSNKIIFSVGNKWLKLSEGEFLNIDTGQTFELVGAQS